MNHGLTGYVKHKCRCDICKAAMSAAGKRTREKNREKNLETSRAYRKAWYQANIEKERAARRAYAKTAPALANQRARYAADPAKFIERQRTAYQADIEKSRADGRTKAKKHYDANKSEIRDRVRERRAANPEPFRARRRAAYAADPQKDKDQLRAWVAAHPERMRELNQRRRVRLAGADVRLVTDRDWRRLCEHYGNRCAYCGNNGPLHQDHIVPITLGGRHSIGNLLPACKSCNSSKKNSLLIKWRGRRVSPATSTLGRSDGHVPGIS